VVERAGRQRLERFDDSLALDAALTGSVANAAQVWSGLAHLEGQSVGVLADGAPVQDGVVTAGSITLDDAAHAVQIGLRFGHVIEPLPPELAGAMGVRAAPLRLISVTFRLLNTATLAVDLGRGAETVPFRRFDTALLDAAPVLFSGDARLRALGWRHDATQPLWRIADDTPLPLTLLSVTTEMRITN
jgi:hypothetical protein